MSEKTLNGTDKVPYEHYQKLEREIYRLTDMLGCLGIKPSDKRMKMKAINIRYLQKKMTDEMAKGTLSGEAMRIVNHIIGEWQKNDQSDV